VMPQRRSYLLHATLRRSIRHAVHTHLAHRLFLPCMGIFLLGGTPVHATKSQEVKQNGKAGYVVVPVQGGMVTQSPQQNVEIIQKDQEGRIPLIPQQEKKTGTTSEESQFMGMAWQTFDLHDYRNALDIFTTLSSNPETMLEAKYGMAMCHIKMKNSGKAVQLLLEVAAVKPHLKDTLPNLVTVLIEQGQFEQARSYAARIQGPQKGLFLARIDEGVFIHRVHAAKQAKDGEKYLALVQDYQRELKQCLWPETFYELAGLLVQRGDKDVAEDMYRSLLTCVRNPDLRIGVYYALKPLVPPSELLELLEGKTKPVSAASPSSGSIRAGYAIQMGAYADVKNAKGFTAKLRKHGVEAFFFRKDNGLYAVRLGGFPAKAKALDAAKKLLADRLIESYLIVHSDEKAVAPPQAPGVQKSSQEQTGTTLLDDTKQGLAAASPEYLKKLNALKLDTLYILLQTEPASVGEVAEKILKINPGDPVALSALAWWHFNNNRFDTALAAFSTLHKSAPDKVDHTIGLLYCLMKLKRFDEALELAEQYKGSEKIVALYKEIRLMSLWDKMGSAASDSAEIESLAKEILAINPDDDNIKLILAWWYFRTDNFETSFNEFKRLYDKKPDVKDHSYGLAISLEKLGRLDEAIAVAEKHRGEDERSASLLAVMYLDKAKSAYIDKKYQEAEAYAGKSLAGNPEDANTQELLDLYKYKQTLFSRAMSKIEGLSGSSYGSVSQDLVGTSGFGISASIKQGIDWIKLPWDIIFSTYGEYKYSTRTGDNRYFNDSGYGAGFEFNKSIFKFGGEYFWDTYIQQNQVQLTKPLYLTWFHDWTKRIWYDDEEGVWLKLDALSGSTYGKLSYDFAGLTGTSISGYINEGIDWFTLPGGITFNTYAEYRLSFRTKDTLYYNAHGPAAGVEFQKKPFTLGLNAFWQMYPERGIVDRQVGAYLRWYYDWDLKPEKDR
jgi:tetratricopeptide (TPR) repeat protein